MAILKCKMCGGDLQITEGMTVCECEYCGSKQTVPVVDNEKKLNLFARANRLRSACEFDKAFGVYESIVSEFQEEAEAYWGLILCKYGIEYVDDPKTGKKIPTCHRSSFDSIMKDPDFDMVMECSDSTARAVYREEAKTIEDIRVKIIDVSSKEEPYDIFICYKETAEDGQRTIDSVIAQDVYKALTEEGYRVFFSRISLEDKLGQEYEPYIFAALNSAKVMLAFGTDYEYYNAVWVKNEWSRFLSLIEKGEKKTLIPCYKDIDAYDMPEEFKRLQAQDMGKVGAIQDLVRGIEKIIDKKSNVLKKQENSSTQVLTKIDTTIKKIYMALEEKNWSRAEKLVQEAFDIDPENAYVHLAKALIEEEVVSLDELKVKKSQQIRKLSSEEVTIELVTEEQLNELERNYCVSGYLTKNDIIQRFRCDDTVKSTKRSADIQYKKIKNYFSNDINISRVFKYATGDIKRVIDDFNSSLITQAEEQIKEAEEADAKNKALILSKNDVFIRMQMEELEKAYNKAIYERDNDYTKLMEIARKGKKEKELLWAVELENKLGDYKETEQLLTQCKEKLDKFRKAKKQKTVIGIVMAIVFLCLLVLLVNAVVLPFINYKRAINLKKNNRIDEAIEVFKNIEGYKDSKEQLLETEYLKAIQSLEEGEYDDSMKLFEMLGDYADSSEKMKENYYCKAIDLADKFDYCNAIIYLAKSEGYSNSEELMNEYVDALVQEKGIESAFELAYEHDLKEDLSDSINECIVKMANTGKWNDIEKIIDSNIELASSQAIYQVYLCGITEKKYELCLKCIESFDETVKRECENEIYYVKACELMEAGQLYEAIVQLNKVEDSFRDKLELLELCKQYSILCSKWIAKSVNLSDKNLGWRSGKEKLTVDNMKTEVRIDAESKEVTYRMVPFAVNRGSNGYRDLLVNLGGICEYDGVNTFSMNVGKGEHIQNINFNTHTGKMDVLFVRGDGKLSGSITFFRK